MMLEPGNLPDVGTGAYAPDHAELVVPFIRESDGSLVVPFSVREGLFKSRNSYEKE